MLKLQKNTTFYLAFVLLLFVNVIANGVEAIFFVRFFVQPGITLLLATFFWYKSKHLLPQERTFVMLALLCLLLGDLALFNHSSEHWFLIGMIFFLFANILYALSLQFHSTYSLFKVLIIGGLMLAYAYTLLSFIVDGLGPYYVPVIIFMVSVFGLVQTAFCRYGRVNQLSFWMVFMGSFLFLVSDSIIAINKFYKPLTYGNFLSLFFYGTSQFLIVVGFLKQKVVEEFAFSDQTP